MPIDCCRAQGGRRYYFWEWWQALALAGCQAELRRAGACQRQKERRQQRRQGSWNTCHACPKVHYGRHTSQQVSQLVALCNSVQSDKTCCWQSCLGVQLHAMPLHDYFSESRFECVDTTCKRFTGIRKLQAYLLFASKVQLLGSTQRRCAGPVHAYYAASLIATRHCLAATNCFSAEDVECRKSALDRIARPQQNGSPASSSMSTPGMAAKPRRDTVQPYSTARSR